MIKYDYMKTLSKFVVQWLESWFKIASTVFKLISNYICITGLV